MNYCKVFVKRISQDGNIVVQAKSVVVTSGNLHTVSPSVTVKVSCENSYSSSSTYNSTTINM